MARGQQRKNVRIAELNTAEGKRLHDARKELREKGAKPSPKKRADGENALRRYYNKYAPSLSFSFEFSMPSFSFSSLNNKWVIGAATTLALSAAALATGAPAITLSHAALTTAISGAMVATAYGIAKGAMAAWNYGVSFFSKKAENKGEKGKKPASETTSVGASLSNGLHNVTSTVSTGLHTAYDYTLGAVIGSGSKFVGSLFHRHQETAKPKGRGSRAFAGMDQSNIIDGPRTRNRAK